MSQWGVTPQQSIELECRRRGRDAVVDGCVQLLSEGLAAGDDGLVLMLGGPAAHRVLSGDTRADRELWVRVWAARGLLWVWEARASPAIAAALTDPGWRVREMALKVVRRHRLGEHLGAAAELQEDPVTRVRLLAERTVEALVTAGA